jgi:hypothetical protein
MVALMVEPGGVCFWQDSEFWIQAVGFVLRRLAEIWLQLLLKFSHDLFIFKDIL